MAWEELAACAGMDTEMFFPGDGNRRKTKERERMRKARAVCAGCPVKPECLEFAIRTRSTGIWGGLTEKEREERYVFRA